MTEINIGQISEALNDKADRDLMNIDVTSGADIVVDFQVPTAENNYTWYRKYKSGWVEQGGICNISQDTRTTVNMPKAFSDTNYQVTITAVADLRTGGDGNFTVNRQTASQFYWCNGDDFSGQGVWCARGMAAN